MKSLSDASGISRREALTGLVAGAALAVPSTSLLLAQTRVASISKREKGHVLAPALKIAREADAAMNKVDDYTGTFHKNVVVGKKRINQEIAIKVREEPFSVYLRFINQHNGREVIYIDGKNNGSLLTHGVGLETIVGTLKLDPNGSTAMEESRYPINMIGMRKMIRKLISQWEGELVIPDPTVKFYPNAKIGSLECRVVQSSHAKKHSKAKFHMTRLYVAKKSGLPVRVEQFAYPTKAGSKPLMLEQYTYLGVKTNVGLKAIDFDTRNPKYDY
jgi:outer membrane lipoprotein-sorting protein